MKPFKSIMLAIALLAVMMLVAACAGETGPEGPAGPGGPAGPEGPAGPTLPISIDLDRSSVNADAPVNVMAYGAGWEAGESVTVEIVFPDGSTTQVGSVNAGDGGTWMIEVTHDGLGEGAYAVSAEGSEASTTAPLAVLDKS